MTLVLQYSVKPFFFQSLIYAMGQCHLSKGRNGFTWWKEAWLCGLLRAETAPKLCLKYIQIVYNIQKAINDGKGLQWNPGSSRGGGR